jgi:hypothetical protein
MLYKDMILSADVVLIPRSGKSLELTPITAANLKQFEPPREAVEEAKRFFANAGFTVGPSSVLGISISAPLSNFERVFAAKIEFGADGSARVKGCKGPAGLELPLSRLPAALGRTIQVITFARTPQFGPKDSRAL